VALPDMVATHEMGNPGPIVRFRYSLKTNVDLWAGTGELAKRMLRDWGVGVRPWGSRSGDGESMVGWLLSRPLADSELDELSAFVRKISQESLAERFRIRGPQEGEAPWAHLGISSESETLKEWVVAHYRSSGINSAESLGEILRGFNFRYCVLPVAEIHGESPYTSKARAEAYASMMKAGISFPPLVLAGDDLYEGFHRKWAYKIVGQDAPCICFDLT
jgi:hypothetical protein